MRSHTNEGVEGRIFYTIHRTDNPKQNLYCITGRGTKNLRKKQNYMTVPAAIRELEKIEMTRQTDNVYRLDHAVTAKQKKNLKGFWDEWKETLLIEPGEISNTLKKSNIQKKGGKYGTWK